MCNPILSHSGFRRPDFFAFFGVTSWLIKENDSASGQCEATITTVRGLSDTAKWYEIWEGVVAVAGMCVRAGYAGLGFHRGELVADNDQARSFRDLWFLMKNL